MNTAGIGEQFREPRHMLSDAYLIRSFQRLSGSLGTFVVRKILGTELFERRRQYLFEDGLPTPDVLRFLLTMLPSEQYMRENRTAALGWKNYFGELGGESDSGTTTGPISTAMTMMRFVITSGKSRRCSMTSTGYSRALLIWLTCQILKPTGSVKSTGCGSP